jgi:hypothetical protein
MKMEQIEYTETSAYKIQRPGNYPEENIQHTRKYINLRKTLFFLTRELLKERRYIPPVVYPV